ncbi:MAG: DegT/DnrJ/EryC1/StrS family aminotransferase [Verrucomicrobiaceae bacterium]|nr:DegT/DnrJ/EryC1/StrS family aminotransferase [Verrucomicrobiaceae bacterium]
MEFIDLKSQQDRIRERIDARIATVLDHGRYIMGPEIGELEDALCSYLGVKHSIGASSGTDTLLIALMALGVKAGDEVITVPYTWISTAEVIALIGAKPVFVDVDPVTWNMDPALLEAAITERTKAIMPVGIYGQTADMRAINEIAGRHGNLPVIEDAAQSFGATHHGVKSGALSTIGSTSFFPSKPLGGYGDGGALFTDDDELAERMRWIRVHGQQKKHYHPVIGLNGRLDTLQAAILLPKLELFPEEVELRQTVGRRYDERLADIPGIECPVVGPGNTSVYAQYTLLCDDRAAVQEKLQKRDVPSVPYYSVPLHLQPVFAGLGHRKGDFPITESIADRCLSLPMSPYLSEADQDQVAAALRD